MGIIDTFSNLISTISSDLSGKKKAQIDLLISDLHACEDCLPLNRQEEGPEGISHSPFSASPHRTADAVPRPGIAARIP